MSINRIKARRMENYKEYIRNILKNRDIDCDEMWWDSENAANALKCLVAAETWYIADSDQMEINTGANFLFVKFTKDDENRNLLDDLKDAAGKLVRNKQLKTLFIICIVDNMKSRVFLEKKFLSEDGKAMKKSIRKEVKGWRGTVDFLYILDNNYGEQDIKLNNINRYTLVQEPPMDNPFSGKRTEAGEKSNCGYVTSVHLSQLVEIYNKIGDKLFKRNVRYGLNEQLGVDRSIKNTLRNSPGEFWFKNNGVTILVERPDFNLGRVGEVLLEHIKEYDDLNFSVVNGAQTITAAAQCLYELEYELEECRKKGAEDEQRELEERIRSSRNAKVLLRIIHIPRSSRCSGTSERGSAKEVNEISVALNRQKPIKAEDIAFASPFVEKMAAFLEREQENGKRQFRLVKRGEGSMINRSVDLVDFSRARKACAGYPGEARSNGTNVLLSFKNEIGGDYGFKDETIFVPAWMEAEEEEEAGVFRKYYGAVNFAVCVADFYGRNAKRIGAGQTEAGQNDEIQNQERQIRRKTVLQNGKWYFTAYMVQLFNRFEEDFAEFTDCFDVIRDKLAELMQLFAAQCEELSRQNAKYAKLDSNVFKNNELYRLMLQKADSERFAQIINRDLDEDERIEFAKKQEPEGGEDIGDDSPASSPASSPAGSQAGSSASSRFQRLGNGKVKFIQMNGSQKERVSSTAHAMVKSVQFILENYPGCEEKLLKYCHDWFTDDQERVKEGYSYLRRAVEVTGEDGRCFWVGTHSASNVKYNQMEDICHYAGVKKPMISWYTADGETALFTW